MPEQIQPANKTVVATQFGPACPQPDMDRLKTSEDCLFVNVWVPEVGFFSFFLNIFFTFFQLLLPFCWTGIGAKNIDQSHEMSC